jgi:hypothetical protein
MKFTFMNLFRKETGAKPAPAPTDNADKRSIKVSILACLKGEPRDAPPQAPGQKVRRCGSRAGRAPPPSCPRSPRVTARRAANMPDRREPRRGAARRPAGAGLGPGSSPSRS